MALALDCVATNKSFQCRYSTNFGTVNDVTLNLAPTNPDGTAYDCTSLTSIAIEFSNNFPPPINNQTPVTGTLNSHGPTGLNVTIAGGQIVTAMTTLSQLNMPYTLRGFDGTNHVLLAQGICSIFVGA